MATGAFLRAASVCDFSGFPHAKRGESDESVSNLTKLEPRCAGARRTKAVEPLMPEALRDAGDRYDSNRMLPMSLRTAVDVHVHHTRMRIVSVTVLCM